MLFEIYDANGRRVMHTQSADCIPPKDQLQQMTRSGYRFKLDGKRWRP